MMVLVVSACPAGLRGDLTRWLLEISPGVFVGRPSARVRDQVWERTCDLVKDGRAIMVFQAANEQGFDFKTHRHNWVPTDFDGVNLITRPNNRADSPRRRGWSKARRR
ncbi:type I-E CRISPR-associated endoribonuclease Cas2e [Corynebacterium sp. YSMAA1_1_F7]|uniref:type I-E CRISPR-associated endoribonuclease Cas2e n=1 Tax=Corynebacterium sp. YSMAA1_1_F7 TaxID=3383590 RepID=UPI0038D212BE